MDLPIPLEYMPYVIGIVCAVIVGFLIYQFRLKEVTQYPLANEEDLGVGKIHLPQLGKFYEGRITSARNTIAGFMAKQITNAPEEKQSLLMAQRKAMLDTNFFLAQRVGTGKVIYMFDANPLDPRYSLREDKGNTTPIRQIGPVQDCFSKGQLFGFEWIGVKLDKQRAEYTPTQLQHDQVLVEAMAYSRDAASNLSRMKFLEDRVKTLEGREGDLTGKLSTVTSEKDELKTGASIHSLTDREPLKVGRSFGPAVKSWFGDWKQLAALAAGYLVIAPILISSFAANATPPTTNYLTAGICAVCYFALPISKKVFGRWL